MSSPHSIVSTLAATLRTARLARGLSIAQLAEQEGVSPRLVSEFERGKRPHVSLDTALRLLRSVHVSLTVDGQAHAASDGNSRTARAEHRRRTWVGEKTTLVRQKVPVAMSSHAARLSAVARASLLAVGLQTAYRDAASRQASKLDKR